MIRKWYMRFGSPRSSRAVNRDEARARVRRLPSVGIEDVQPQLAITHLFVNGPSRVGERFAGQFSNQSSVFGTGVGV